MKIKDLSSYNYTKIEGLKNALAVGWLEGDDLIYSSGKTSYELITLLKEYKVQNCKRGVHLCQYCSEWGSSIGNGNGEIWVFNNDKIYVTPYLIIHYIEKHNYKPPDEFIDAVLNGFRPHSPGYEMIFKNIKLK